MTKALQRPSLWLITLIVALPQVSETIYTPSLPDIARALYTSNSMVEYTLTVFLFGFAVGVLLWGNLSDRIGRRPTLLIAISIYIMGCIGCWFSSSITMLMFFRFIQAFGGSVGSVVGQTITRDCFASHERGKIFSTISIALSCSPSLGPILGGLIDQYFGWGAVFLVLTILGTCTFMSVFLKLSETNKMPTKASFSETLKGMRKVLMDKKVLSFGFLIGVTNGILFSLYGEAPFYMIEILGLKPSEYGFLYLFAGGAFVSGGWMSRYLSIKKYQNKLLLLIGNGVILFSASTWAVCAYLGMISSNHGFFSILLTVGFIMALFFGVSIIIPNALSHALEDYKHMAGTAASTFGFYYYILISVVTFGMGSLHNGTVIPMPFYFVSLSFLMCLVYYLGLHEPGIHLKTNPDNL